MNPTNDTLALMKAALGGDDTISKTITTANGLVAYDLQAPAKNLYPVYTPLRNKIPRVPSGVGVATNWRTVSSIVGSGFDNQAWIPEGQRSGRMSYNTVPKAANYVTIGEEDSVTFEAVNAGKTFEDVRATMASRLLQKLMLKEENAILGGNASLQLGTPATPTLSAQALAGATLPALTYSVIAVALTQEGFYNSSVSGGVALAKTVTGADGGSYTIKGGSSNKSANATQVVTLGQSLTATATTIQGAIAWAWFVGPVGSETLQAITTTNQLILSTPLAAGMQAATAITTDNSANPGLAYDGLLTAALNPANQAYVKTMATGNAGLTSSGRGSVVEIDTMLKSMWDNYQLTATVMYVNSQEMLNITNKVMSSASGTILRYNNAGNDPYAIVAGGQVSSYFNPFMPDGGAIIPVKIHPKVPPGTVIVWAEELPMYYQNNEVSNVAEVKLRADYYSLDWPVRTRQYETGVYAEGVLAIYATFALGVITNITNA
ncbi:MAG TPA: hypothetical protein VNW52_00360 [Burkholderiaceae bacterium]|jgi:hypothetical protein|nr:hypothetical protein [Burkholderiaceae bacterium]